jgi:hypothetical protein
VREFVDKDDGLNVRVKSFSGDFFEQYGGNKDSWFYQLLKWKRRRFWLVETFPVTWPSSWTATVGGLNSTASRGFLGTAKGPKAYELLWKLQASWV